MQSGARYEELGTTPSSHIASPLSHSFLSSAADDGIQTARTKRGTAASASRASHVSVLSGSSFSDAADAAINWGNAGRLFQEKIHLLRKSVQEHRAACQEHQQQQRRGGKADDGLACTDSESSNGPKVKGVVKGKGDGITSSLFLSIPPPVTWCRLALSGESDVEALGAAAKAVRSTTLDKTPIKEKGVFRDGDGDITSCVDNNDAASVDATGVTASPDVMVVVSPLRPTGFRRRHDAATMTGNASPASSEVAGSVISNHKDYVREGAQKTAQGMVVVVRGRGSSTDAGKGQIEEAVGATATSTEMESALVRPPLQCRRDGAANNPMATGSGSAARGDETRGSVSAVHRGGNINPGELRGSASYGHATTRRSPSLKRTTEIRTLRAPSEIVSRSNSSSGLKGQEEQRQERSDRACAHFLSVVSQLGTDTTETRWAHKGGGEGGSDADSDDDGGGGGSASEPAPRKPTKRTASQAAQRQLERLVRRGEAHVVVVDNRSLSSENLREPTLRVLHGRNDVRRSSASQPKVMRSRVNRVDNSQGLRSRSPSIVQMGVNSDTEHAAFTPQPHPSSRVCGRGQSGADVGDSASARQRRCLLRQIKLIDAEIGRIEQVPWNMSLRSGAGSSIALDMEKAKLVMLRRRYESELRKAAGNDTGTTASPPSARRQQAASVPRSGPSVYEAILQQQQRRGRHHGQKKSAFGNRRCADSMNTRRMIPKRTTDAANDLPPRAQPLATMKPRTHGSLRSTSLASSHASDSNSGAPRTRMNGISGRSRSLSLDAERMAMLYLQNTSSSSSLAAAAASASSSSSAVAHDGRCVGEDGVPVYWRIAHSRRETTPDTHGRITREVGTVSRSSCESESPSSDYLQPPPPLLPLPVSPHRGGDRQDHDWCEEGVCSDVPADQYYCVGYGEEEEEEDVDDKLHSVMQGRTPAAVHGCPERRSMPTMHTQRQNQQREGHGHRKLSNTTCSRSRSLSGVRIAAAIPTGMRTNRDRPGLCFRLRAPPLQEAPLRRDSKHLYFRPDPKPYYEMRYESPPVRQLQPQPQNGRAVPITSLQHEMIEEHPRFRPANASPTSCPSSSNRQSNGACPLTSLSARGGERQKGTAEVWGRRSCSHMADEDGMGWTSPPRSRTSPPTITTTPPPLPTLHSRTRSGCQGERDWQQRQQPCLVSVRDVSTDAGELLRRRRRERRRKQQEAEEEQERHLAEERTPYSYHHCRHSPEGISSQFSEVRVSPLTECSPCRESPVGSSLCTAAACRSKSRASLERGPDFRQVMMTQWQRRSAPAECSPPKPLLVDNKKTNEGPNASGLLSSCASAAPSFMGSKPHRHLGDDRTNEPYLDSPSSTLHMTRQIGAGGVTLRQLFGHDSKPRFSSSVSCQEDSGKSSTDILLDRINRMRALME